MRSSLLVLIAFAASAGAAEARQSISPFVPLGTVSEAPAGFTAMCAREPSACASSEIAPATAGEWTHARQRAILKRVNRIANRTIRWRPDPVERWELPTGQRLSGDCEDIALAKRAMLIAAGYPAQDLFMVVGYLPGVGLHAALVAHTDEGDYILDNRTYALRRWGNGPYTWILRQAAGRPEQWRNLLVRDVEFAAL